MVLSSEKALLARRSFAAMATLPYTSSYVEAAAACTDVPVNVYAAKVSAGGPYYSGLSESVISIFDPSLGAVTGGGTLLVDGVNGTFAVNGKYKNAQPQGDVLYIAHKPGADVTAKSGLK